MILKINDLKFKYQLWTDEDLEELKQSVTEKEKPFMDYLIALLEEANTRHDFQMKEKDELIDQLLDGKD